MRSLKHPLERQTDSFAIFKIRLNVIIKLTSGEIEIPITLRHYLKAPIGSEIALSV